MQQTQVLESNLHLLSNLTDELLVLRIKDAVSIERKSTTQVLHYLREIEVRRLHLSQGYSSLHEFVVHELGYDDGSAYRRISAMRLMYSVPVVEKTISNGSLSLTNAAKLNSFFKTERKETGKVYTVTEKVELIEKVKNQSTRQCEQILAAINPLIIKKDRERIVSETEVVLTSTVDQELISKFKRIKDLIAHSHPNPSNLVFFHYLADLTLSVLDPEPKPSPKSKNKDVDKSEASAYVKIELRAETKNEFQNVLEAQTIFPASAPKISSRYIPKSLRNEIWRKYNSQCSYVDPKTTRRCSSRHKLEIDHITPHALNGSNDPSNLRLVCSAHNKYFAIKAFGSEFMGKYLRL